MIEFSLKKLSWHMIKIEAALGDRGQKMIWRTLAPKIDTTSVTPKIEKNRATELTGKRTTTCTPTVHEAEKRPREDLLEMSYLSSDIEREAAEIGLLHVLINLLREQVIEKLERLRQASRYLKGKISALRSRLLKSKEWRAGSLGKLLCKWTSKIEIWI